MLYPRVAIVNGQEVLVQEDECVGFREHLTHKHRTLILSGQLTGETDSHNLLLALDTLSQEPIKIIITSGGGELDSAFLLYDTMRLIQSPVITIGRFCASAAVMLLAAGSKRYLFPHARTMIHLPSGILEGNAAELEIQHQLMLGYKDTMVAILQECGVKKTKEEILKDMDRDFWMTPHEAIEYGLADEILTPQIWVKLKGTKCLTLLS